MNNLGWFLRGFFLHIFSEMAYIIMTATKLAVLVFAAWAPLYLFGEVLLPTKWSWDQAFLPYLFLTAVLCVVLYHGLDLKFMHKHSRFERWMAVDAKMERDRERERDQRTS